MENKENKKTGFKLHIPLVILAAMVESAAAAAAKSEKFKNEILKGVNLCESAGNLIAAATDSARLNYLSFDPQVLDDQFIFSISKDFNIILAPADVAKIAAAKKEAYKQYNIKNGLYYFLSAVIESDDGENVTFSVIAHDAIINRSSLSLIPGEYPNLDRIMPADRGAFISFNPSFLGDVAKAAKALAADGDAVIMQAPTHPMRPFVVDYQSGIEGLKAKALITPMKAAAAFPGFDELKDAPNAELQNRLRITENVNQELHAEIQALKKQIAERPATDPAAVPAAGDVVTLETVKAAHAQALADLTKATQENNDLKIRLADLEKRLNDARTANENANNEIKRLEALSGSLRARGENLRLALENCSKEKAALLEEKKQAEKKPDGGNDPATERQRAYIAKLGGTLPDGATIRDASILITQLKKGNAAKYSA